MKVSYKNNLINGIGKVEKLAVSSKLKRMLHNPFRYIAALVYSKAIYPFSKKGIIKNATTFFGKPMKVCLPAALDIYLTGGKTHNSEIRLAKYLLHSIKEGDIIIEAGAHFGYFSLLLSELSGSKGHVYAFEASLQNFQILKDNAGSINNISIYHNAISNLEEKINFYEFPVLYSEYNTSDIKPFEKEKWFNKYKPLSVQVQAFTIDRFIQKNTVVPSVIKIDVEGGEYKVISGAKQTLTDIKLIIIMEYLSGNNEEHRKATSLLKELQYNPYFIQKNGELKACANIEKYLKESGIDSDNIVFIKS